VVSKWLKKVYAALIFAFLYAPIIVLAVFSFNESKSRAQWTGFTLDWYAKMFHNRDIKTALYYTLLVALISSVIATIAGVFAAAGIYSMKKAPRTLIMNVSYLPVLNPDIVTGIALMILFISANIRLGFGTMLIAHITFSIPYVILAIMPKLRQMSNVMMEAAMDLGAKPLFAFTRVIIPQISPGIVSGFLIAFTLSIDDFVISFFTTGSGVTNLSIVIYSMARRGVKPEVNALCTLMFLSVLILMLVVNRLSQKAAFQPDNKIEIKEENA